MRLPYINKIFYAVFNFLRSTAYNLIGQEQIDNKGNAHSYRSYHYDQQGNTILLTDEQTQIKASYSYDPYGQTLKHEGEDTAYRYSGKHGIQTDQNDLLYMRARYYDPSSKRFLGQDILLGNIQEIKSLNRYAYVQGNPMKYIDPTGLHPFEGGSYEGDRNSYNKRGDILGQKKKHKTRTTNPQEIWNLTKSKTTEQLYEISQNCNDPNARNALQAIHLRNRLTGQATQRNLQRWENFTNSTIWAAKRVHAVPGMGVAYTSYEGLYVTITGDIDSYNFNNLSAEDYYADWEFRQMSGITSSVVLANFLHMAGLDQSIFSNPGDEQTSSPSTAEIANSPEAQQREIVKSNLGNEYDITPSENHSVVKGSSKIHGEPNSSVDIHDSQGELQTRRWYGPDGRAYRDIDFTQHRTPDAHPEFPHEHFWDWTDPDHPDRPQKPR